MVNFFALDVFGSRPIRMDEPCPPPPPAALMSRPFGGLGLFLLSARCCDR